MRYFIYICQINSFILARLLETAFGSMFTDLKENEAKFFNYLFNMHT